jgi:NAD+ diphosphatase
MTITDRNSNPFSGATLDRRSGTRTAADWLADARADTSTRFVISRGTSHLVRQAPEPGIAFLERDHPLVHEAQPGQVLLLGWFRGSRCVLVNTLQDESAAPAGTQFEELRPMLPLLSSDEAAVLACARALLVWRSRHRHCGVCGAPTAPRNAGHALRCTSSECGAEFFPRIDPAIIVLVGCGDEVLLGRQASWPPGRYSALAGFVEAGESLEDTVAREVYEEVGIRIERCHYFASQPWPFPSSLMVGFHATAARSAIALDGELEDARWHSADELDRSAPGMLPPPHTIARQLLESWFMRVRGRALNAGH